MNPALAIAVALVLLAGNAFFVGAEFALISARRTQIEPAAAAGSGAARTTLKAMEQVSLMMAGAQLGITLCSLGLGAVGEPAVAALIEPGLEAAGVPEALLHPIALVLALTIVVYLHMVLGEMVPKNIAIAGPERAALLLGPPMFAVVRVLRPIIVALNLTANAVLRVLKVQPKEEVASSFTADEVAGLVQQSHAEGLLDADEEALITAALDFTERTAEQVLLPAAELVTVRPGTTVRELEQLCARTGYSRFPVAAEDGELRVYVHVKDLLGRPEQERDAAIPPEELHELATVGPQDSLRSVLRRMQEHGSHLAQVRTEGGPGLGVVALEDVVEELVGQVADLAGQRAPR